MSLTYIITLYARYNNTKKTFFGEKKTRRLGRRRVFFSLQSNLCHFPLYFYAGNVVYLLYNRIGKLCDVLS